LLFVNKEFGALQYVGFGLLFTFYTEELCRFIYMTRKQHLKEKEKKQNTEQILSQLKNGGTLK
jgi:hypothetical protein